MGASMTTPDNALIEAKHLQLAKAIRSIGANSFINKCLDQAADAIESLHAENAEQADRIASLEAQLSQAQAVPDGWREQFSQAVYEDIAAADNQDVPLEEYPNRILKVLDSIVGSRHPTVVHWRNDAIRNCIAIAYRYCRDPESHRYLKQDLEAMLAASPTPPARKGLSNKEGATHD